MCIRDRYDPEGLGEKLFFDEMENDRYIEVWNVVFSQYDCNPAIDRKEYKELPQKNIDTGIDVYKRQGMRGHIPILERELEDCGAIGAAMLPMSKLK